MRLFEKGACLWLWQGRALSSELYALKNIRPKEKLWPHTLANRTTKIHPNSSEKAFSQIWNWRFFCVYVWPCMDVCACRPSQEARECWQLGVFVGNRGYVGTATQTPVLMTTQPELSTIWAISQGQIFYFDDLKAIKSTNSFQFLYFH